MNIIIPERILSLVNHKFKYESLAPYTVYMEGIEDDTSGKQLKDTNKQNSPFGIDVNTLGMMLHKVSPGCLDNVYDFKIRGRNKFCINFVYYHEANDFVEMVWHNRHRIQTKRVWVAYIPSYKVSKRMIIRGIDDIKIEPNFIKKQLKSGLGFDGYWYPPVKVERLQKKSVDPDTGDLQFIDTKLYIATFDYTDVANRAVFLGKSIFLAPYIQQVRRCTVCQRLRHTKGICRTGLEHRICEFCGQSGHSAKECPEKFPRCINCIRTKAEKIDHRASDRDCPTFIKQKAIKKIMVYLSLSPREAELHFNKHGELTT